MKSLRAFAVAVLFIGAATACPCSVSIGSMLLSYAAPLERNEAGSWQG